MTETENRTENRTEIDPGFMVFDLLLKDIDYGRQKVFSINMEIFKREQLLRDAVIGELEQVVKAGRENDILFGQLDLSSETVLEKIQNFKPETTEGKKVVDLSASLLHALLDGSNTTGLGCIVSITNSQIELFLKRVDPNKSFPYEVIPGDLYLVFSTREKFATLNIHSDTEEQQKAGKDLIRQVNGCMGEAKELGIMYVLAKAVNQTIRTEMPQT